MWRRAPHEFQRIVRRLEEAERGRYENIEYVAEGGHAYTFKARDSQDSRRLVAIKIAKPDGSDIIDEGLRVAMLGRHVNIVQVFRYVRYDEGERGLVMAFVDGGSLRQGLHQLKGDIVASVDIAIGICRALEKAHEIGIVHRDVKPENILMSQDGVPMLTDFGIATEPSKVPADVIGSIAYMAPEYLSVDGHVVDKRSDLYSLAVVLFEMLEARTPHVGDKTSTLIQRITNDDPPSMNAGVPGSLQRIIYKGLERDPSNRYQSASEMLFDLEMFNEFYQHVLVPLDRFEEGVTSDCDEGERARRFLYLGERYLELGVDTLRSVCDELPTAKSARLRRRLSALAAAFDDGTFAGARHSTVTPLRPHRGYTGDVESRTIAQPAHAEAQTHEQDGSLDEIGRLLEQGDIAMARTRADELLSRGLPATVYRDLAQLFYSRALSEHAVIVCEAALLKHRNDADLHAIRGKALLLRGANDLPEAVRALKEALDLGTQDGEVVELYNDFKQRT